MDDCKRCIGTERDPPHHHFVEHDAQGVNVSAGIEVGTRHGLFGRDILGGTDHAVRGECGFTTLGNAGKAEICKVYLPIGSQKNIGGFNITVQNAALVSVCQG